MVTVEQAQRIIREEHSAALVAVYHDVEADKPSQWWVVRDDLVIAAGRSWGEVFAAVTGEAPI